MTSKEIFEAIDLEKVGPELKTKLLALEKATEGFTNERADARMETSMNAVYNFIKDKKPEALKNVEVKTVTVEETITKTQGGKKVRTKQTIRKKVAGKRKKNTKKTPTPSAKNPMPNVPQIAREIREEGESWSDALSRAKVIYNKKKDDQKVKAKKALDDLRDFMKSDKFLKGWPRTYGKEDSKENDLERDLARVAKAPGRRISKTGRVYYENRDNRSDREADTFPRKIYLKDGGDVNYRTHNLFELGGEVMVEPTILQNNPDYITSTATMSDYFEKGGKLKYDPSRDVEAIVIKDGPFPMLFKRDDFIGGAYQMEKGGLSENYYYFSPRSILFARLKTGEEIKPLNGFWIKKDAKGLVYAEDKAPVKVKKKSALGVSVPRPLMVSGNRHKDEKLLKMLNDFTASDALRPAMTFVALKDGEIVATDAHRLIRLIDGSTAGMNEGVCMKKLCSGINYKELNFPSYKPIIQGLSFDHSEDYDLTDLYQKVYAAKKEGMAEYESKRRYNIVVVQLELKNETLYFNAELLLSVIAGALKLGWKNAFISYTEGNRKAIIITEDRPSSMRGFEGKDLILLMPILSGGSWPSKKVKAEEVFELGGEVMIEPTILQNNPDYITSTATMSGYFEKGGMMGMEVKKRFEVDFYKNSSDRQTSQEEIIRGDKFSDIVSQATKIAKSKGMNRVEIYYKDLFIGSMRLEDQYQFVKGRNSSKSPLPVDEFAKGGYVAVSEKDGYWYIISKPTSKEEAQQVIDMGVPRGEMGKVVTIEEAKAYKKVIGREYLEKGGALSDVEVYQNVDNPNDMVVFKGNTLIFRDEDTGELEFIGNVERAFGLTKREFLKEERELKKIDVSEYPKDLLVILEEGRFKNNKLVNNPFLEKGGVMGTGRRVMPFLKFELATEARKKLDKGELPVFDGGIGFAYLEKEKKLYYLRSVTGDWEEVGEFKSKKESIDWLSEQLKMQGFAEGGAIGFDALAKKVAKRYAGKKVKPEYQDEYGKTYSDEEAMEVGRKVAAKVYRQQQAKMSKGGSVGSFKGYNYVYYDSTDYNYPYMLIIGNLAWGISDEFGPTFLGNIQQEFFNSTQDFANKHGYRVHESSLPENVAEWVKEIRAKNFDTLRGKRYNINPNDYPARFEKGGNVESMDKAWEVKVMRDDEVLETFTVRGRNRSEAREVVEDYHEDKMERKHGDDIFFAIEEAPAKLAKGGAMEHMIMKGDEVLAIHKNMLIVESDLGQINVIDLSTEPIARRISIEPITGKNTLSAAKEHIDYLASRKPKTMAKGGSLFSHGLKEGDLIVEELGSSVMVLDEDGETFYVDLREGERYSEEPLPFEYGGEVKANTIARLAAKYNKNGQEVDKAIWEGSSVELEHTNSRYKAMLIAIDHLEEDFYYYQKLKAAEGKPDFSDFYEKGGQVPEQFLDSKGERKIDAKSIEELTDYVMALPQTKSIYFNEDAKEYVPSRRKLHADIINKFKEEVVCITEGQPIAIFMGGSPASGKSSFLRKYSPYLLKEEILKVDADEIRAMLPEYEGYNAAQTHLETKDIVNTLLSDKNIGIPCDFDLIYDGTMNSVKSYIPLMDILRKRGYKIFIVYMDKVPKDVIVKRALERYKKSGRFVPLEVIDDFFEKGTAAFNQLKKDVDGYMVIDGSNQDYEIIEQGGIKLPKNREYAKLGSKIDPKDIPALYKKGGKTKKA